MSSDRSGSSGPQASRAACRLQYVGESSSEIILGIDLGTTYSTAAAFVEGKLQFALDSRGEACVPSVVHFPKSGAPVVGADAERLRGTDPQNTVWGIKRLIGQTADSPAARVLDASSAFTITSDQPGGEACVTLRGRRMPASEIASLILRYLRERAEARFLRPVTKAIITVPVTASPALKEAVIRCGKMAGLDVLRTIPEPVAGALSRGVATGSGVEPPFLVYDFGGGTFDVTVVQREGGKLRVLSAGGDDCLGGDDFDLLFSRRVADQFYKVTGQDMTNDAVLWDRVQRQCERVKRALTNSPSARFCVTEAFRVGEEQRSLDFQITRAQLEPTWHELVERSIECTAQTVADAGLAREEVGNVLLIGGTTFVAQVRRRVAEALARPCILEEDPQTAVARGAAMLAAGKHLIAA
jgi:molecular chaperone DnaK